MTKIEGSSRETGLSLSRKVIDMLSENYTVRERVLHHDFDFLFGSWTKVDGEEFDKLLAEQRQIDSELWQ